MRGTFLAFFLAALAHGQSDNRARFEVVSVKPSAADSNGRGSHPGFPPGKVFLPHTHLNTVIPMAYGVQPFLVYGGPEWLRSDPFDITGELPATGGVPPPQSKSLEALQVLLEERFKLRIHREPKVLPQYSLTIAKGGTKLVDGYELPADTKGGGVSGDVVRLVRKKVPVSNLIAALSFNLQTPVEDHTGLTGVYSFVLEWRNQATPLSPSAPGVPDTDEAALLGALRSQLGLSLERGKGPVEVLVIDSAERPAAN